jgi:hypothetical protein
MKPRIFENPVVIPVDVGDAVPGDVLGGGGVAGIGRRQRIQVV